GLLLRLSRPKIKIGLIPHFEIPLRYFIRTVPIDKVLSEGSHKVIPAPPILRRGNIRPVPERMKSVAGRQLIGHETDFHERAHSRGEQSVVDLINVGKVVNRTPLTIFGVDADFVVKNAMKAYVVEVSDLLYRAQVAAITFTQAQDCASRAEHLFPEVGKGMRSRLGIDDDYF